VPDTPRSARKIDITGMVLMAVALLGLINGISRLQTGLNLTEMVPIVIGGVSAAAFVMWERHTDVPALDLRIFRSARFVGALSAGAALNVVAGGASVVLVYYLVIIRAEPTESYALLLIPATLIGAVASVAAGRAAARFGDRNVLLVGLTLLLAALLGQLLLKLDTSLALPAVLMAMSAFGGAFVVVPQATIMMASAPTELGGVVSAVRSSVGMTAYSLGSAFFSLVGVTLGMRAGNAQFAGTGITAEWARDALRVAHGADVSGDGGAGLIDPEQTQRIVSEMAQIMVDTIHVLTLIMAVVPAIAMVAVLILVRGEQQSVAAGSTEGPGSM
jgi:Na+/melibiose symporter-like transporter